MSLAGDRCEAEAHVRHNVADDVNMTRRALTPKRLLRPLVRAEEKRRDRVYLDAVVLLGHREVAASKSGFHMHERNACGDCRARSGEGRVRVPVHEDQFRPLLVEHARDPGRHRRGVRRLESEPVLRLREPELLEEHVRQLVVVVLSCVNDDLGDLGVAKRKRKWRRLNELRPVSDDGDDPHRRQG